LSSAPTRLVVARVRGLHGLGGVVRVEVLTDRPEDRFAVGAVLFPEGGTTALTITEASPVADGPGWWLAFRGIVDRVRAEPLRDAFLEIEVDRAADLAAGQAYWHEVIGAEVFGTGNRSLGRVADVYRAGESEVYVVRGGPVGEFDLPAVHGIILEFAPARGRILVDEAALDLDSRPVDAAPPKPRKVHRWSRHGKGRAPEAAPAGEMPAREPPADSPAEPEPG
jgi:16S rRNA processing protein RimM